MRPPTQSNAIPPPPAGNIVDYLFERCLTPDLAHKTYIHSGADQAYSFEFVYRRVCQVSNFLRSTGIVPEDRVMMLVHDGPDFPSIFCGIMKMGGIAIAINTVLMPHDYEYYLMDSGAKMLFIDHELLPLIEQVRPNLKELEHIIVTRKEVQGYAYYEDVIDGLPEQAESFPRAPSDVAFWQYTSGSTGDPKGVVHLNDHIFYSTELFAINTLKISAQDLILSPLKMFYGYGFGNQVCFPLRTGASIVANPVKGSVEWIWESWLKYKPTVIFGVPTLYSQLVKYITSNVAPSELKAASERLRFCVCGGELLPPALFHQWRELTGVELLDGVGTTEMTHMFIINRPGAAKPGSCGTIVEGYQGILVDDDLQPVPPGEIGNLLAKGPTAAPHYRNKPQKTAQVMRQGGILTGDKFYQDEGGCFFYMGRSDDMLRVGGQWVSPTEVEAELCEHPSVLECAVVGIADQNHLIKPKAFVVLRDSKRHDPHALEGELIEFVRGRLAHYKCPRWIEFLAELPKTTTGKIQRFRLRN